MIVAAISLIALLGVTVYAIRCIRASADREVANLQLHLRIEQERTADLLTRLAARSIEQYHAVAHPPLEPAGPPMRYVYDDTGLVQLSETAE